MAGLVFTLASLVPVAELPGAGNRSSPEPGTRLLRAARLLDVTAGRCIEPGLVLVRDGRIVASGVDVTLPPGADVVDLPGATLLPGLIDAHVHLAWGPPAPGDTTLPGTAEARATLEAGFTTVRNPGSTGGADIALARAVARGRLPGPRIIPAGAALGLPGGVCDQVFAGEGRAADSAEIERRVAALADSGARLIKFCAGGGVIPSPADTSSREYDGESMRSIVAAARARGLPVAAHAQGAAAIRAAVEAGVKSIEHGGWIDPATARLMADRGTVLVPTLYRLDWLIENAERNSQAGQASRLRSVRRDVFGRVSEAARLGVPIAFGTDATVIPHGLNAREFAALVEIGLTPLEAIRSATTRAALLLDLSGEIGTLAPGARADIIAVEGDPLSDVRMLESVRFVMADGRIIRNLLATPPAGSPPSTPVDDTPSPDATTSPASPRSSPVPPVPDSTEASPDRAAVFRRTSAGPLRIPFDRRLNQIAVRGILSSPAAEPGPNDVGSADSVWVIIDTGASASVMDEHRALSMGLELGDAHHALGGGGAETGHRVENVALHLPGLDVDFRHLATVPLDAFRPLTGRPMDLILGSELFHRYVAEVDYDAGLLTLHEPASFDYRGPGHVVPVTLMEEHPYVEARVTLPGRQPVRSSFVIDTGSSAALILSGPFVEEHRVLEAVPRTVTVTSRGVGGVQETRIGRVDQLEIDGIRLDRPVTALRRGQAGRISAPGTAGNIGGEIISRFRAIFDYSRFRMILEPGPALDDPFESDMSGLGLRAAGAALDTVEISRVQEGSPAFDLGIQPGDVIESVDGRPSRELGLHNLRDMFRREGRTYRLGVVRKGERLDISLRTRRLI